MHSRMVQPTQKPMGKHRHQHPIPNNRRNKPRTFFCKRPKNRLRLRTKTHPKRTTTHTPIGRQKMRQRQIYALNVNEPQMKGLLALVTEQRKQLAKTLQEKGDAPDTDRIFQKLTQLKGIEKALETSIYFHDKFYEENKKQIKEKRATLKKAKPPRKNSKTPQQSQTK